MIDTDTPPKVQDILVLQGRLRELPAAALYDKIAAYRTVILMDEDQGPVLLKSNLGATLTVAHLTVADL